jgi:hypothetical protein
LFVNLWVAEPSEVFPTKKEKASIVFFYWQDNLGTEWLSLLDVGEESDLLWA